MSQNNLKDLESLLKLAKFHVLNNDFKNLLTVSSKIINLKFSEEDINKTINYINEKENIL